MYNRYLDDFGGGSFVQLDPEPRQGQYQMVISLFQSLEDR